MTALARILEIITAAGPAGIAIADIGIAMNTTPKLTQGRAKPLIDTCIIIQTKALVRSSTGRLVIGWRLNPDPPAKPIRAKKSKRPPKPKPVEVRGAHETPQWQLEAMERVRRRGYTAWPLSDGRLCVDGRYVSPDGLKALASGARFWEVMA